MNINTALLRVDGFSEEEIKQIQERCDQAERAGRLSRDIAVVQSNGNPHLCLQGMAEILDTIRPGCWLDKPCRPKVNWQTTRFGKQLKLHYRYRRRKQGLPSGEFLWARQVDPHTALIDSIPFMTGRLAYGDLVRFNQDREITRILGHFSKTRALIYADEDEQTREEIEQRYAYISEELGQYDIDTEGMVPGLCSISVPKDIDDDELESIARRLDADVVIHDDEL